MDLAATTAGRRQRFMSYRPAYATAPALELEKEAFRYLDNGQQADWMSLPYPGQTAGALLSETTLMVQQTLLRAWQKMGFMMTSSMPAYVPTTSLQSDMSGFRRTRSAKIQSTFGLTLQQFAAVLGISRPTLYTWMNPSKDVLVQRDHQKQIDRLDKVAAAWVLQVQTPIGPFIHQSMQDGRSLLDWLADPGSSAETIIAELSQLEPVQPTRTVTSTLPRRHRLTHRSIQVDD